MPGRPIRPWIAYLVFWLLIALLFALRGSGGVASELGRWLIWAAVAPWVYGVLRRLAEPPAGSPFPLLLSHVASALGFSLLAAALDYAKDFFLALEGAKIPLASESLAAWGFHLLVYGAVATAVHLYLSVDRSRGRAVRTGILEAQLSRARLQALKAQLHPHFLFNTLNAVSALVHRNPDAAERMIALLSDLLRVSLDQDERHQVTVREELGILERYLAIERIRFRDRLSIEIDVEDECFEALVPRLILQPLVENSIIHGIALQSTAGLIAIRARRKGNRLEMTVSDDGPGLLDGRPLQEGVGLSNTRGRLVALYGSDHRFTLERASEGGLEVALEMPFEHEPRLTRSQDGGPSASGMG